MSRPLCSLDPKGNEPGQVNFGIPSLSIQPARGQQGAVFTVRHGDMNATWVNTVRDTERRYFQYVYFLPEIMITTIDVRLASLGAARTKVHVTYPRTALTSEGNRRVQLMTGGGRRAGVLDTPGHVRLKPSFIVQML